MKKTISAAIGLALSFVAQAAHADLYRLSDRIGVGTSLVYNTSGTGASGYGLHGDYSIALYSWSHSIYAQTDYTVDIFHTDVQSLNWSLIVTRDFGTSKLGGYIGALMQPDAEIYFSAGATGMVQLGSNTLVQGEIGAVTDGRDGAFFMDNTYFGQIRADYEISDTYGVYAKYARLQNDTTAQDRGVVGVTYAPSNSPWIINGGIGAYHDSQGYQPLLSAEFKYEFGGEPLPQQPSTLAGTYFDRFDFADFNIR